MDQAKIKAKQEFEAYCDAALKTYHQAVQTASGLGDPHARKQALHQAKDQYVRSLRITKQEAKERVIQLMKEVGIPEPEKRFYHYPFQYSGGMRQRIVIAIALATVRKFSSALTRDRPHVTSSRKSRTYPQVKETQNFDLSITPNSRRRHRADRIAVMYAGKIVEFGETNEIFYNPRHPYTWALLSSMPDLESRGRLDAIPGTPPNMLFPPKGDAFAPRNKYALKIDYEIEPPMFKISETHFAATWLPPTTRLPCSACIVWKLQAKKVCTTVHQS